ncbi:MAG TPA: hypothetical protein PKM59_06135 [Thermodesulfobacteriota bacterium]|nr:hypothetical protein [Thermodesulfobacteriota bacterium]HNU71841.1 hypothetical protein [Thermodesulfobacteriota bacterium]
MKKTQPAKNRKALVIRVSRAKKSCVPPDIPVFIIVDEKLDAGGKDFPCEEQGEALAEVLHRVLPPETLSSLRREIYRRMADEGQGTLDHLIETVTHNDN